jgi:hypothetical protein
MYIAHPFLCNPPSAGTEIPILKPENVIMCCVIRAIAHEHEKMVGMMISMGNSKTGTRRKTCYSATSSNTKLT